MAVGMRATAERLYVALGDGREIGGPLAWYPRLASATEAQHRPRRLIGHGEGVRWPDLHKALAAAHLRGLSDEGAVFPRD